MCNSKILLIFLVLITVFFKNSNAYISTLDSNLVDVRIFMGVGGILFLIWILISQTLVIFICGKKRKGKQKKNTETDMEIASDTIDQKLFQSVEERKAKRRTERRRKVLAHEGPGGSSGSAVKRGDGNGNEKSDVEDEEEEESPPEKEVIAAAAVARKKKKNANKTADDRIRCNNMQETEEGYAVMTPKNWQK